MFKSSVFVLLSWLGLIAALGAMHLAAAQLEYPEAQLTDKGKANAHGRTPLYSPSRCGKNELLYPGDQPTDWICDCAPAALYHPETESCYMAFRQGPCPAEQILVLGRDKIIPECIANPCKVDGQIPIHEVCYTFGLGPPCQNTHLSYVLGVHPDSFQVDCVRQSVALKTRIDVEPTAAPPTTAPEVDLTKVNLCARGTKRFQNGRCS